MEDESCSKKHLLSFGKERRPSVFKDCSTFLVVFGKKPAWEASSFPDCCLPAPLTLPRKKLKLVHVCREVTPPSAQLRAPCCTGSSSV